MIEKILTNGYNKIIGKDEDGYYVATLIGDIITKKHHIKEQQLLELVKRWVRDV